MAKPGRWLRDVDVGFGFGLDRWPTWLRAPSRGGFICNACFTQPYRAILGRSLRTECTVKVVVELDPSVKEPWTHAPVPFEGSEIARVRWPFNLERLRETTAEDWVRIHFEEMHAGLLFIADRRGWSRAPFEEAATACLASNLHHQGYIPKTWLSPDRRHCMKVYFDMDYRCDTLFAVLCDREGRELGRAELVQLPANYAGARELIEYFRWTSTTSFQYKGPDGILEPLVKRVCVDDMVKSNEG